MQPAHHQVVKPGRRIPRKSLRLNIYTTDGLVAHSKPFAPRVLRLACGFRFDAQSFTS